MPVYPPDWTTPALNVGYPQMQRRDAVIWERFLAARHQHFERVAYNVAFGGQIPDDPDAAEAVLLGWQYSTAVKVDAVLDRGDEVWLCEVKPGVSLSALGQVLGYFLLADREGFDSRPLVPTIITDSLVPDVAYCAEALNIQVILAPEAEPPALLAPVAAGT